MGVKEFTFFKLNLVERLFVRRLKLHVWIWAVGIGIVVRVVRSMVGGWTGSLLVTFSCINQALGFSIFVLHSNILLQNSIITHQSALLDIK